MTHGVQPTETEYNMNDYYTKSFGWMLWNWVKLYIINTQNDITGDLKIIKWTYTKHFITEFLLDHFCNKQ